MLTGVNHIVNQINTFTLASDMWNMQELPLDVWIPKFKFEFTSHLEQTLREVIYSCFFYIKRTFYITFSKLNKCNRN